MRIGIHAGALMIMGAPLEDVAAHAVEAEADGFSTYWLPQSGATDALTLIAVLGAATSSIEFATAVVPTWGRHPHVLAGQALTVQAATGNRLALGIGVAHKPSVEDRYHIPFERPVRHLREYLDVLQPLMADRAVDVVGEIWSCTTDVVAPPAEAPPVLVAALGPQFLRLTGKRADGTVLWLVGPTTVADHIVPTIGDAAAEAGRPAPRDRGQRARRRSPTGPTRSGPSSPRSSSATTPSPATGPCSTGRVPPAPVTWRSSAARTRSARAWPVSPTPARPTSPRWRSASTATSSPAPGPC